MTRLIWRPIDRWPRAQTVNRETHNFKSTEKVYEDGKNYATYKRKEVPWTQTRDDLLRELRLIGVEEAQLQLAITENDLRIDGEIKANARLKHPGVILSFIHPEVGAVLFACDRWTTWQANARGVAKGLEALRLVDRYGITQSFEQYTGWKALPSGVPMPAAGGSQMTVDEAAEYLIAKAHPTASDPPYAAQRVIEDGDLRERIYRQGAKRLHPDVGGSHEEWTRFEEAKRMLDKYAS